MNSDERGRSIAVGSLVPARFCIFYKDIHLSLKRCVKKTANTEAECCHMLQGESLPLCLFTSNFSFIDFEIVISFIYLVCDFYSFLSAVFLVNLCSVGLCPLPAAGQCKEFLKLLSSGLNSRAHSIWNYSNKDGIFGRLLCASSARKPSG